MHNDAPSARVIHHSWHRLSESAFDALAGGAGDAATLRQLWAAERSHRLLLLDLLMDVQAREPTATGPLAPAESAWQLLVAAQRRDGAAVEETLLFPETGLWLARVLRRLRGAPAGAVPLWADVGQLHVMAAAVAVRAGLDFSLSVPARSGTVWLPGLGRAVLPGLPRWDTAQVTHTATGRLRVSARTGQVVVSGALDRPADGWQPPRLLTLDPDGPGSRVFLDDISFHRVSSTQASPPLKRLPDRTAAHWAEALRAAWRLLADADPQSALDVAEVLRSVEPVPSEDDHSTRSASSGDAVGRLATTQPDTPAQLAAVLVHEVQHSKLNVLMHLYALHGPEAEPRLYAPWRNDPRPLRGMLQGVYAFTGVTRFWRGWAGSGREPEAKDALAWFEFALWRRQLLRVLPSLRNDPELTPLGRRLVERLTATVSRWGDDPVPAPVLALARDAADDHATTWRLYHLVPDPDLVAALADAWCDGTAVPEAPLGHRDSRLRPDPGASLLDRRAALLRLRLGEPLLFDKLVASPEEVATVVRGAVPADLHLASGDAATAAPQYTRLIATGEDPDGAGSAAGAAAAWAGLALAARRAGQREAAQALLTGPEVVRAVYRAAWRRAGRAPDPLRLAGWLHGPLGGRVTGGGG